MESMSKRSRISNEEDGDVLPEELIHCIQSFLPLQDAVRTCILSKSWLRAWYTLPTLILTHRDPDKSFSTRKIETKFNELIHTTLQRYHISNTPLQSFHLLLNISFKKTLRNVGKWIRHVVSNSCLKELSLDIRIRVDESFTLPNELFSTQGLHTIRVTAAKATRDVTNLSLRICSTNVINCVSLRVLDLNCVYIDQGMFHNLLSTCSLLEKIKLTWCGGLHNVKVENLLRLNELDIFSIEEDDLWEINNVPSLCSFRYRHLYAREKPRLFQMDELDIYSIQNDDLWEIKNLPSLCSFDYHDLFARMKPIPFQMDSLTSVTQLCIEGGLIFNNSFFDTLESKFPVLESLTIKIYHWELTNLVFTSSSLKWLTLTLLPTGPAVNVQVYAPKLLSFIYTGKVPGLLFRTTAPKQVKLTFSERLGYSYFLKMREALNSSSKFNLHIGPAIGNSVVPLDDIDVEYLRRRALFPVENVELELATSLDEHAWEQSRFFDAFFLICHPSYIRSRYPVIKKMIEGNTTDQLKEVLLKNSHNGNWEALTTYWKSVLHTFIGHLEFKLIWFAQ